MVSQHRPLSLHGGDSTGPSKILIHAINYAPELIGCGKYTSELARFLQQRGHTVEVVTAPPHYPGWVIQRPYRAYKYMTETIDKIAVTRCPMVMKKNGGGAWRLLAPLTFAILAAPMVIWRALRFHPDVIMCVEPTLVSAPAVLLAAKLSRSKSVLHVQDLEVDAAFGIGHLRGAWFKQAIMAVERRLLLRFNKIITISANMRTALISKGLDSEKIEVVRNWVDLDTIKPRLSRSGHGFRDELGCRDDDFVVLYAGHIGPKQALNVVLDAARRLVDQKKLIFVIVGDGPMKNSLQKTYADLTNVIYLPLQDECRLNDLLSIADLHVLPQMKGAADLVMPSKLGGMLASGRPIVITAEPGSELANVLEDIALIVPAGDSAALFDAILRARVEDLSLRVERGLELAELLSSRVLLPSFETHLLGRGAERQATHQWKGISQQDTTVGKDKSQTKSAAQARQHPDPF
jgi:colanic acid biosynthesis glycosyl transferase WcaI